MYSIYLNSEATELNYVTFSKSFIDICNSQRDRNKAIAFAFILYDFENPQIHKVLNDKDYWLALHKITGDYLSVFSINYKQEDEGMEKTAGLTSVDYIGNPANATNKLIEDYFGKNIQVNYPALLFFQVNERQVIDALLIEIRAERIQEAFIELKQNLKTTVEVLKKIDIDNKKNFQEIFNLIENKLISKEKVKKIMRITKAIGGIVELASSIQSIV